MNADLSFRRIDAVADADIAYGNYREAALLSFEDADQVPAPDSYLPWLARRVEEFPDGHVLAILKGEVIGQLELQVPYGSRVGYVNLFHINAKWRRLGFGRQLHEYAEKYFRSWEADTIELHVAKKNLPAIGFYRSLGYRSVTDDEARPGMRKMQKFVPMLRPNDVETKMTK